MKKSDDDRVMYKFKIRFFVQKKNLGDYMVSQLHLTKDDGIN